jgi:hypothetical protein
VIRDEETRSTFDADMQTMPPPMASPEPRQAAEAMPESEVPLALLGQRTEGVQKLVPRKLNLKAGLWTMNMDAVTCPKCRDAYRKAKGVYTVEVKGINGAADKH